MTCQEPSAITGTHARIGEADHEEWRLEDKVRWTCSAGYGVVKAGVYTQETTVDAKCSYNDGAAFDAPAPTCGILTTLVEENKRYQARVFPSGENVKRQYAFTKSEGATINVAVYKRPEDKEPRTAGAQYSLTCGANKVFFPDIWIRQETGKNSIACSGTFVYKHKAGSIFSNKDDERVKLTLILGQDADKRLVMAAQEQFSGKDAGAWMEVVA
jgi:hypothetical protein